MKRLKTLFVFVLTAMACIFVSCNNSQQKNSSKAPKEVAEKMPESDPSKVVQCYDSRGNVTPQAAAWSVDSVKIVYEHRPSEIVMTVHNLSANYLGNLKGVIDLYGDDGRKYDSVDFNKSCKIHAGETGTFSVYLGDQRVHPNQEWNRDVQLHFAKTAPGHFSYIGSDNSWCECIAKVIEIRILSFEVLDKQ